MTSSSTSLRICLAIALACALGGSAIAARTPPLVTIKAPPAVKERLAAKGTPYRTLAPGKRDAHVQAIVADARGRGANAPSRIISLGGTGREQQFYLEYGWPGERATPYTLVRVRDEGAKGLKVTDTFAKGSRLVTTPRQAWSRAALALYGYESLHKVTLLGASTRGTLVYRQVGTDNLGELQIFKGAGGTAIHRGRPAHFSIGAQFERAMLSRAGIKLE